MSQTYDTRRKGSKAPAARTPRTAVPGPSLGELAAGARPSTEQMGRRVDLPGEIREKMEASFGADFSGVRVYESDTVAQAGAEAMTQGRNIAFAPGRLNLASTAGQALLGHELSHVVSQARGESAGRGFLANANLEAQADRQGMLAARGESAYQGPVTPVSASSAAGASGPMQAKKDSTVQAEKEAALEGKQLPGYMHPIQRSRAKGEYLDKRKNRLRMADLATDALARGDAKRSAAKNAYEVAAQQFMTERGVGDQRYGTGVATRYSPGRTNRYLQSSMLDRTEEERQAMLKAFSKEGSDDELIPYLVQDIKKYGFIQSDDVLSDNDEDVLNAYARDAHVGFLQATILDVLTSNGFDMSKLVGEGRLTQEELDRFVANKYSKDIGAANGMAKGLQLMGAGLMEEGRSSYEGLGSEYRRARREGLE